MDERIADLECNANKFSTISEQAFTIAFKIYNYCL